VTKKARLRWKIKVQKAYRAPRLKIKKRDMYLAMTLTLWRALSKIRMICLRQQYL